MYSSIKLSGQIRSIVNHRIVFAMEGFIYDTSPQFLILSNSPVNQTVVYSHGMDIRAQTMGAPLSDAVVQAMVDNPNEIADLMRIHQTEIGRCDCMQAYVYDAVCLISKSDVFNATKAALAALDIEKHLPKPTYIDQSAIRWLVYEQCGQQLMCGARMDDFQLHMFCGNRTRTVIRVRDALDELKKWRVMIQGI